MQLQARMHSKHPSASAAAALRRAAPCARHGSRVLPGACAAIPPGGEAAAPVDVASLAIPQADCFVDGIFFAHLLVRDYELDQFNVVNNAHYMGYMQHARHRALAAAGMSVGSLQAEGVLMALSEATVRYKAPLRSGDAFVATAAIGRVGGARVAIDHLVLRCVSGQPPEQVSAGRAEVVFLDGGYRPIRVPPRAKQLLQELADAYKQRGSGAWA